MKKSTHMKILNCLLAGTFCLNSLGALPAADSHPTEFLQLLAADAPAISAQTEDQNERARVPEITDRLSDGWKYAIAIFALFFFLGIALFIQIRSERE